MIEGRRPSMSSSQSETELSDRVTMPLLTLITQQSLDEDYRHVADRRRRAGPSAEPSSRLTRGTAAAVLVFGLLIATAAVQTSRNASTEASGRAALVAQINRRNDQVAEQQSRLRSLRDQNTELQAALDRLTRDEQGAAARVLRLKARTGFTAVHGPGLRIVVDDGPSGDDSSRVRDEDLSVLVDGLWNAGAEAISINGQRLTVLAPIRTSGVAIHVNNRPISPPYVVLAIGDTATLQSRFADSTHGLEWIALADTFGFEFDMENEDLLEIPGARMPQLLHAGLESDDEGKQEVAP